MNTVEDSIRKGISWQAMEYRKSCYAELEKHNFSVGIDYDAIFEQIDKEISDEYATQN